MLEVTLLVVALFVLIIAAYVDIKTLEVPDWINYSGIVAGMGIHLLFSLQQWNYWPVVSSMLGFGIAFAIACLMFYTGQWGGGDAKLLMALGAIIGFEADKFAFGTSFLINLVIVGGAWGLVWSTGVAVVNWKNFWKTFKSVRQSKKYKTLRIVTLLIAGVMIFASFMITEMQLAILGLAVLTYLMCYLTIFIKSVEICCMHKWITPDKLTEGDWLVYPVKIGKRHIVPPRLGLDKRHVALLKKLYKEKKLKKVFVKYGVPFAPAFLIAFVITAIYGNFILAMIF